MARLGFWQSNKRDVAVPATRAGSELDLSDETGGQKSLRFSFGGRSERLLLLKNHEDSGQGWFWSTDAEGRLTYLTEHVAPLLCADRTDAIGSIFTELFIQASKGVDAPRTLSFILMKKSKFDGLTLRAVASADERWWAVSGSPQYDGNGNFTGYRGSGVDVTEQRKSSEHASMLAMYDSLTGLSNRLRMSETLETNLLLMGHQKRSCAIMLIDLDRFKQVNDTLGHPAGDALLKQVAERLIRIIGDRERVFRLGGDEFQIIVRNCDDRGTLGDLANQIIASLSQPYSIKGSRCIIGASIGVAISPVDGHSSEDLIRNADLALYAAKDGGRGRFRFFSEELLQVAEDKRALEEDLRDALANGEIQLFYQPIVNAKTNVMTGVEALVRWHHPTRGPISPALFIPIAEEADLIEPLGEWVLRKACEDAATWPGNLKVSVNVSPIQFTNDALPAIVLSALASSGLEPGRLELEITEGVFLSDSSETDTMFATLKGIGVRLALDDFGTGYSSLSYLRTAPFDKIKIDQSFVRAATLPASRNRAIIAAIVALAEALGMETTAEGIESHDQLDLVRHLRVTTVQGYIYSKAVTYDQMTERLAAGDWKITPAGPARQRSDRLSMYRTVGAIYGNHFRSVLIRNLSETGALIEGLMDVPVGASVLLDFGEGQLMFARVLRSRIGKFGVEFEHPMVSDGNGGLCTSHRVSPYLLGKSGLPSADAPGGADPAPQDGSVLDALRDKLGLPPPADKAGLSGRRKTDAFPLNRQTEVPALPLSGNVPTVQDLAVRYLHQIRSDKQRHMIDRQYLQDEIMPRFGHLHLDDVAPSRISDWLAGRISEEGLPPAKVGRLQGILGQMYVLAMQGNISTSSVALQGISIFNRGAREQCLSTEEIHRLTEATHASANTQLRFVVSLLILTGTRQRELLKAQWDQIDLVNGLWQIPSSESENVRTITLSGSAIETIRELPRWDGCPYLVANPKTKKPFRSLFDSWDTARRRAGLADLEIDDLRHSMTEDPALDTPPMTSTMVDPIKIMLGNARR